MSKYIVLLAALVFMNGCEDSLKVEKVQGHSTQPYTQNAVDAAGVAEGDKQISPNGRPAY